MALCFAALLFLLQGRARPEAIEHATILYTNDLQARVRPSKRGRGGLARIGAIKREVKSLNPNTLLLDAGDAAAGTAIGAETRGAAVFRVMNAAGYDAMVIGNHEFDYGREALDIMERTAEFPLLACNVAAMSGEPVADSGYALFELGAVRAAVIGAANPATPFLSSPERTKGLKFEKPGYAIKRCMDELEGRADIFIVLSHLGFEDDKRLAQAVRGIDLIVGGHSEKEINGMYTVGEVNIVQAGHYGEYVGRVDIFYDLEARRVKKWKASLISVDRGVKPDAHTDDFIAEVVAGLPLDIDRVIGGSMLGARRDWIGMWTAELMKEATGADYGILNKAGIRDGIVRGEITVDDVYRVMPFEDRLACASMIGKDMENLLERENLYHSSGPRIESGKVYRVAVTDFLAQKDIFRKAARVECGNPGLRGLMLERIETDKGFKTFWKEK